MPCGASRASPDRVTPPCPCAGPGLCGGCDLQHVALHRQRALKADVVREQMARLAHLELDVDVEPVPGDADGLDWRTRVEFAVDAEGRAGLRRHRSHDVVAVDHCRIAAPGIDLLRVTEGLLARRRGWSTPSRRRSASRSPWSCPARSSRSCTSGSTRPGRPTTAAEQSLSRELAVSARGFWQVHPGAARTFVEAVMAAAQVRPGERALDLYAGVGLFASALAAAVGADGPGRRRRVRPRGRRARPRRTSPTSPTSPC